MKKNEVILDENKMNESKIDVINSGYDFEWFGDDLYGNFVDSEESPLETINIWKFDSNKIDELVESEDYMWLQEYLDELVDEQKMEANEYVQTNFPKFLQDEEWSTFEPMKWNTIKDKELLDNLDKKPHFNRIKIKWELWDALIDSYKNAA